jgi:S-disulfanyl-L-cysteine oxidoreductase SoxD
MKWRASMAIAFVCAVNLAFAFRSSAQDQTRRSVREGAFTAAQAERGERDYGRACERCHGADLSGDPSTETPALEGEHFREQWSGRTVKELFDVIKRSMPADAPDSLTQRAYVDIVAYLLSANQFASGTEELPRAPERLQEWVIR